MSEPSQAAETTPQGTAPLPTSAESGAGSTPATESFETFEARENAKATGAEWKEPGKVTTTAPDADEDDEPVVTTTGTTTTTPVTTTAPTPEKPVSKRQQQINDLIRRSTESDLRAKSLEAKLAALEAPKSAAEPKTEATAPVVDPNDPEPQEAQFEDYRAFVKALSKWEIRQDKREAAVERDKAQREHAERSQVEAFQTRAQTWVQRRDAFAATTPEFSEKALPFLDTVTAGTPIGDVLLESEVGPQVALYLATHPDEADRIARLAPISALRALGKLEAKFDTDTTSASASAGPAAKTVTSAPAPPMTLTSRSAIPADPAAAALARGDFEAWEAEENRKALAAER